MPNNLILNKIIRNLSTVLVMVLFSNSVIAIETITLTTTILPPYQKWDSDNKLTGIAVEPIQCAFDLMNQPFEFQVLPWKRAQQTVQTGKAEGFFIASQNNTRDNYATISRPIIENEWRWYVKKNSAINTIDAINQELRLASITGTNMMSWLKKNFKNTSAPKSSRNLFAMLDKDRIDAALLNIDMFNATIPLDKQDNYHSLFAQSRPLGVYFSNIFLAKEPSFMITFNKAIQNCLAIKH